MNHPELKKAVENEIKRLEGSVAISIKFLNTDEVVEINNRVQFWAASIIKIPVACEFFKQVKEGNILLSDRVQISTENVVEGSGVIKLLDNKNTFTHKDLVTLMLAISDNVATNQIVDLIGWENVEKYMKDLGLEDTTFRHKMMIKAGRGPNLTTAGDVALLLEKLYKRIVPGSEEIIEILKNQQDRTRIPLLLPNDVEIAHKTGSLPEAMHDVGIVFSKNPFIFVFLSDDQKDKRLTNDVLSKSARYCFDYSMGSGSA